MNGERRNKSNRFGGLVRRMNPREMADKIVDGGIPMLLKGGGEVTVLKLRYCPVCGSAVKLNYSQGLAL